MTPKNLLRLLARRPPSAGARGQLYPLNSPSRRHWVWFTVTWHNRRMLGTATRGKKYLRMLSDIASEQWLQWKSRGGWTVISGFGRPPVGDCGPLILSQLMFGISLELSVMLWQQITHRCSTATMCCGSLRTQDCSSVDSWDIRINWSSGPLAT